MGARFRVLLLLDDAAGGLAPFTRAMSLMRNMPNVEFTAFARTLAAPIAAGSGTVLAQNAASRLVIAAAEAAHAAGVPFRVHETGAALLEAAARECDGHDLLVLPKDLGYEARVFGVPVLLV